MSRLQQGLSKLNNMNGSSVRGLSVSSAGQSAAASKNFEELKRQIHGKLVEKLDFTRVKDLASDALRRDIRRVIEHLCDTENPLLNRMEREKLIEEILDETLGFGPLEPLLKDPTISDILVRRSFRSLAKAAPSVWRMTTRFLRASSKAERTTVSASAKSGKTTDGRRLLSARRSNSSPSAFSFRPQCWAILPSSSRLVATASWSHWRCVDEVAACVTRAVTLPRCRRVRIQAEAADSRAGQASGPKTET